jgi:hypothetical protein
MQKALMQMNVQLHHVVSDITGATGLRIVRAIAAGTHAPEQLATYRDVHCGATEETIREALTGNYRAEHVFGLKQALELWDFHQSKVAECDLEIEAVLKSLNQTQREPERPIPAVRHAKARNEPKFDVGSALYTFLGADLSQIHGFGRRALRREQYLIGQHRISVMTRASNSSIKDHPDRHGLRFHREATSQSQRNWWASHQPATGEIELDSEFAQPAVRQMRSSPATMPIPSCLWAMGTFTSRGTENVGEFVRWGIAPRVIGPSPSAVRTVERMPPGSRRLSASSSEDMEFRHPYFGRRVS